MKTAATRTGLLGIVLVLAFTSASRAAPFIRGDSNGDGTLDISDPVKVLGILFLGEENIGCDDALDANDDGQVDISDAVASLGFQFLGTEPPPPPHGACGDDPTADLLDCDGFPFCPSCLDEPALNAILDASVEDTVCLPAPVAQTTFLGTPVVACPPGLRACPDGTDGCTVVFTVLSLDLDAAGRRALVHAEGVIESMPVDVGANRCLIKIEFTGDIAVPFTAQVDAGGNLLVTDIGAGVIDRTTTKITLSHADPNPLPNCNFLIQFQSAFTSQMVDDLEPALNESLQDLRTQLVGTTVCAR